MPSNVNNAVSETEINANPKLEAYLSYKYSQAYGFLWTMLFCFLPATIVLAVIFASDPGNHVALGALLLFGITLVSTVSYGIYSIFTIHRHIPSIVKGTKE